jgi:hypothetical protein
MRTGRVTRSPREAHGLTIAVGFRLRVDLKAISVQVYQPHFE